MFCNILGGFQKVILPCCRATSGGINTSGQLTRRSHGGKRRILQGTGSTRVYSATKVYSVAA